MGDFHHPQIWLPEKYVRPVWVQCVAYIRSIRVHVFAFGQIVDHSVCTGVTSQRMIPVDRAFLKPVLSFNVTQRVARFSFGEPFGGELSVYLIFQLTKSLVVIV